jgi:hypothetical protein
LARSLQTPIGLYLNDLAPTGAQLSQIFPLMLITLTRNQLRGVGPGLCEVQAPKRNLDIELREVRTLQMVDQVRRREDQRPVNELDDRTPSLSRIQPNRSSS